MRETTWKLFAKIIMWHILIVLFFYLGIIGFSENLMLTGAVISLISLIGLISIILTWLNRFYIISEEAISKTTGLLVRRTMTFDVSSIASVKVRQSIFGQVLNYGDVILENPLTKTDLTIKNINNPYIQASTIEKQRLLEISKNPHKKVVPL
jgi:uncharacterized membrane protein YdbT with pleckstrin-like domain